MKVTREGLYTEIWAEPMTTVAERYEVSSNYLGRICERLKIPRPPRGYWQRLAVGKADLQEPLPELDPGDEFEWNRGQGFDYPPPPDPQFTAIVKRGSRREARPKTHPIVMAVQEDFEDTHESKYRDDGYLKPKNGHLPDILVSKETLRAAISVANKLYLALEDHGYWVRLAPQAIRYGSGRLVYKAGLAEPDPYGNRPWRPSTPTLVFVGGVAFGLTLFEIAEEVPVVMINGEYVRDSKRSASNPLDPRDAWRSSTKSLPNGKLGLYAYAAYNQADWQKYWLEEKRGSLPGTFEQVCAELEAAAPKIVEMVKEARRRREEQERIWEQQRKVEARKEAERRRKEAEEQRRKQLLTNMQNWQTAKNIRTYVGEVTKLIEESGLKATKGGSVEDELTAALAYADELDPVSVWREEIQKALATLKSSSNATSGTDERDDSSTQNEATDNEGDEANSVR